jgi:hypothetical protein
VVYGYAAGVPTLSQTIRRVAERVGQLGNNTGATVAPAVTDRNITPAATLLLS